MEIYSNEVSGRSKVTTLDVDLNRDIDWIISYDQGVTRIYQKLSLAHYLNGTTV